MNYQMTITFSLVAVVVVAVVTIKGILTVVVMVHNGIDKKNRIHRKK